MIKERGKTESTGINPNSPRARLEREKSSTTKRSSITPKERRAQMMKDRKENFLTRKGTKPAISERAKKIQQAKANVEKDLPRGTPAPSQMEDYKPKTAVASAAASGVGAAAKKPSTAKRAMAGLSEFGKAFAAARKAGKKDFTFRDKQYAAITKQEVKKAGASDLGEYLNKLKRSGTTIAKAPGQITKKTGGTITLTGEQKQTAKEKMKARRRAMKGMAKYNVGGSVDKDRIKDRIKEGEIDFLKRMRGQQVPGIEGEDLRKLMPREMETDFERPIGRRLKELRGAAMNDAELRRLKREGMKSGGSVMARGCKMGRKKPTKLY